MCLDLTPSDVARLRADTPASRRARSICKRGLGPAGSAGDRRRRGASRARGGNRRLRRRGRGGGASFGAYAAIARLINAQPREIALVENATVAWMQAFYALPLQPATGC